MVNQDLAQGVKELRKRKALSQEELAKKAGLSLRTVQRVENGETIPTGETLKRLASVLEVAPNELIKFESEKEKPKLVLKTKYEYVHFFDNKLIFSKTPAIDLVADYNKSVTYVFRTLIVMLIAIPLFTAMGIFSYNVDKMELVFMSGSFAFCFLVAALNLMLFSSGTPVVNIADIINIKMENKSHFNILNISILESGRIKQRGLILEKDHIQPMKEVLLAENLMGEKDFTISPKKRKILMVLLFLGYLIFCGLFTYFNPKYAYLTTCFQSGFLLVIGLILVLKMFRNSLFLNRDELRKGFL